MKRFEGEAPVVRLGLPYQVKVEIARFILLTSLAQMEFRSPVDGEVTCSDASTLGGGLCASKGLTSYGMSAVICPARGDLPEEHDIVQVLSVGLFDGIAALRVACDVLGLPMAGHVSIEKDSKCRRVVESFFPETEFFEDVCAFEEEHVKALALKFSNVGLVLVGAGPPCQGVSGLNADRLGALRDERSCLFQEVPRITALFKRVFYWAQVHELVENVASMSSSDRAIMSEAFQRTPCRVDAKGISLCARPRLYWTTWECSEALGVSRVAGDGEGWEAYDKIVLEAEVDGKALLLPGWSIQDGCHLPTFTTSRPRNTPGRRPAGVEQCSEHELQRWYDDFYRFPPYQYRDSHGLWSKKGEWRRPSAQEREACMRFPVGYTKHCVVKAEQQGESYEDARVSLIGNSWHVGVVAWLLGQLTQPLGVGPKMTLQDIVDAITPGKARDFPSMLMRPPHQGRLTVAQLGAEERLVAKCLGLASSKGEDLLVHAVSDPARRYFRLRASVPGRLWHWREISGWRWKLAGEHINVLELRAILTSVKWKVSRSKKLGVRFLHLTDSLVCLHALTRGRSSSRKLRPILMRLNALLLAADLHPLWGYIHTSQNPADRPSRRPVRRRWGK